MKGNETEKCETPTAFVVTGFNELMKGARPAPTPLFGDMWLMGEISVMFGEAGSGKSVLAVQIADSIARGKRFEPFDTDPGRQKVIYLDLETSTEQFCSRYKHDDKRSGAFKFSRNLIYASASETMELSSEMIERLIEATGAKVLVIDNIAHLMRNHSSGEMMRAMRELRRLCRRRGVSILLLVHAPPASLRRGIEARDMPFANVITAVADNIFAVGRVGSDPSARYVKHLRPGPAAHVFGASHVPWFRLKKRANFTYFDFRGFAREAALRLTDDDRREWQLIDRIGELKGAGMSVREIGRTLEMSKTTVQKYTVICDGERSIESINKSDPPVGRGHADDDEPVNEFDVLGWAWGQESVDDEYYDDEEEGHISDGSEEPFDTTDTPAPEGPVERPLLERDSDRNGREIWVEARDYHGRPLVWYLAETNRRIPTGKYTRYEQMAAGKFATSVDALPTKGSERAPPG